MIPSISKIIEPRAINAYAQGTIYAQTSISSLICTSGQLPVNPETNTIPTTIQDQTKQVLENIRTILHANQTTLQRVLKITTFLTNAENSQAVNEVYMTFFTDPYPDQRYVAVAALPFNAKIEIDIVAVSPDPNVDKWVWEKTAK